MMRLQEQSINIAKELPDATILLSHDKARLDCDKDKPEDEPHSGLFVVSNEETIFRLFQEVKHVNPISNH